jgi:hypothetical protein
MATYALFSGLDLLSPRFYFITYLILVLLLAVILLKFRTLSLVLVTVAFFELALATVTHLGTRLGLLTTDLLPSKTYTHKARKRRFEFHPVLVGTPTKNFASENIRHNSLGLRGSEIDVTTDTRLINIYGGSTTYDTGVQNGATWPENLQTLLGDKYKIANFGVPGYSTVEHIIQTAFYSDILGKVPNCSIYYIGWNDIRNAYLPDLDHAYADFHLLDQVDNLDVRASKTLSFSPLLAVYSGYMSSVFDTIPYATECRQPSWTGRCPSFHEKIEFGYGADPKLEDLYRRNIKTIIAINRMRGTKSVFIGQLLNRFKLTEAKISGWLPFVKDVDVWPLQRSFNNILKTTAVNNGASYIELSIDQFNDADFVDGGHFSVRGSEKFSRLIRAQVHKSCSEQRLSN